MLHCGCSQPSEIPTQDLHHVERAQKKLFMERSFKLVNKLGITWHEGSTHLYAQQNLFLCSCNLRAVCLDLPIGLVITWSQKIPHS